MNEACANKIVLASKKKNFESGKNWKLEDYDSGHRKSTYSQNKSSLQAAGQGEKKYLYH